MKIIILAGGGGTRLFPLSRSCYPKQFMKIDGTDSLLMQTVKRFMKCSDPADLLVVTNQEYFHHVRSELVLCHAEDAHIILEPVGRNTAPAIALAARYCQDELGCDDDEILFVTPSDHAISKGEIFIQAVRQAETLADQGKIVTFGIRPVSPETGYGYIQAGEPYQTGYHVASFKEKPDLATAKAYVAAGNYYWNSGMFAFPISAMLAELKVHQPSIYGFSTRSYSEMNEAFAEMPNISIDYAVAEKSQNVVTLPLDVGWNDIGSWDAIYDLLEKDQSGNALQGDCLPLDCKNNLILGRSRLIAGIGLEDMLVVETDDVILVAKKGESQKVKDLVQELKQRGRREASEQTTMYRPWGSYEQLGGGPGYKMRRIVVNPGEKLSMQLHYHRSEHWIIMSGTAKVTVGDKVQMLHENSGIFVPQSTKHRLENPGRIPLTMIEVQNGSYLEEDDIVRFDEEKKL
ncbi:mannose-1-phosphate guanylyltransferase/mannose-6-phosphate isomerase [Sporomusaceae bacterium BoRhaA]|uniref:mannose-1-phosphate guanylyltransferase/mannose-6-phosphate isomerase n=1 Tax=Pelorhabdus rhamnosifermentans TaxID=2772457 RepID=UPI001C05FE96|nr:mannose-1-phosphate guanylyltransferase/mannose-6-phosphate isomerase [Pelorhabdus rhamnosifermentans]MBU2699124.1 mannose-1-phosphate guanylyltransferase/mannose-6-phosphate isomerase [Pelorhabdus rhamnosifermentans]